MKRAVIILLLAVLILSVTVTPAFAEHGDPVGGCPRGFELHHFMEHSGQHPHRHIGLNKDINGDGWICVKHITPDLHLHIDNLWSLP